MRTSWVLPVLLLSVLVTPASAKGCLKGAVVGGVAGHYAGHHGVIGAAAGCLSDVIKRRNARACSRICGTLIPAGSDPAGQEWPRGGATGFSLSEADV